MKKLLSLILLNFLIVTLYGAEFISWSKTLPENSLEIHQIDNPREIGDIYIIIAPDKTTSLIDTGVINTGKSVLIKALEKRNIKRIDQLIISHFHSDHSGGALTLLADPAFEIGKIICTYPAENEVVPGEANSLKIYRSLKVMAKQRNIPWIEVNSGDILTFGTNVSAEVIGGATPYKEYKIGDHNGQSLVFNLKYQDFTMLFTGDLSWAQEKILFKNNVNMKCDVLKMAHHGGAGSNSDEMIDRANAIIAVATQPEWLARDQRGIRVENMLKKRNITYFRSWEYPDLIIFSNGKNFGLYNPNK